MTIEITGALILTRPTVTFPAKQHRHYLLAVFISHIPKWLVTYQDGIKYEERSVRDSCSMYMYQPRVSSLTRPLRTTNPITKHATSKSGTR